MELRADAVADQDGGCHRGRRGAAPDRIVDGNPAAINGPGRLRSGVLEHAKKQRRSPPQLTQGAGPLAGKGCHLTASSCAYLCKSIIYASVSPWANGRWALPSLRLCPCAPHLRDVVHSTNIHQRPMKRAWAILQAGRVFGCSKHLRVLHFAHHPVPFVHECGEASGSVQGWGRFRSLRLCTEYVGLSTQPASMPQARSPPPVQILR